MLDFIFYGSEKCPHLWDGICVRVKVGELGVKQAEPRLEPKKHRRQSRKTVNQSILDELDDEDDDDDDEALDSENPILRAMKEENQ